MDTKTFLEKVEELGLWYEEKKDFYDKLTYHIYKGILHIAEVEDTLMYEYMLGGDFTDLSEQEQSEVFMLITEYVKTPLEERGKDRGLLNVIGGLSMAEFHLLNTLENNGYTIKYMENDEFDIKVTEGNGEYTLMKLSSLIDTKEYVFLKDELKTISIFDIPNYYNEDVVLHALGRNGEYVDGYDEIHYKDGKIMIFPTDKPLKDINAITKEYVIMPK